MSIVLIESKLKSTWPFNTLLFPIKESPFHSVTAALSTSHRMVVDVNPISSVSLCSTTKSLGISDLNKVVGSPNKTQVSTTSFPGFG